MKKFPGMRIAAIAALTAASTAATLAFAGDVQPTMVLAKADRLEISQQPTSQPAVLVTGSTGGKVIFITVEERDPARNHSTLIRRAAPISG